MGTLWTPGGEHEVGREPAAPPGAQSTQPPGAETTQPPGAQTTQPPGTQSTQPPGSQPAGSQAFGPPDDFDDDEAELSEEQIAQMRELEERLAATPASVVVANHAYGLFELAALHLGRRPPNLGEAQTAIDAMGALVEGMGDRLGEHGPQLQDGLAQLRMAFVHVSEANGQLPSA